MNILYIHIVAAVLGTTEICTEDDIVTCSKGMTQLRHNTDSNVLCK